MRSIQIHKIIKFSLGIPLILSIILFILISNEYSISPILGEILICTLIIFLSIFFGLVTPNDFFKNFEGEIIDEYETLNWRLSKSFWLVIFIIQVILIAFPNITLEFSHTLLNNNRQSEKSFVGFYMFIQRLPIILFVFKSFIYRSIRNEKEIIKYKRREKIIEYVNENRLDKINYYQWIKDDAVLQKDKKLILELVKKDCGILNVIDESLKKDREIVLEAVKSDGVALYFVDEQFKKDREVVLEALKNNEYVLKYADESLQNDPEILNACKNRNN
jgi:hypothetical protein